MDPAAAITAVTFPPVAAFAWLFTPFVFGALVARSHRLRTAVARHLRLCLTAGWIGLAALVWGAISLDTGTGEAVFLLGGPLGGLSIWTRTSGADGPGDEPPPDDEGHPPEWDWERFERELADYDDAARSVASRP